MISSDCARTSFGSSLGLRARFSRVLVRRRSRSALRALPRPLPPAAARSLAPHFTTRSSTYAYAKATHAHTSRLRVSSTASGSLAPLVRPSFTCLRRLLGLKASSVALAGSERHDDSRPVTRALRLLSTCFSGPEAKQPSNVVGPQPRADYHYGFGALPSRETRLRTPTATQPTPHGRSGAPSYGTAFRLWRVERDGLVAPDLLRATGSLAAPMPLAFVSGSRLRTFAGRVRLKALRAFDEQTPTLAPCALPVGREERGLRASRPALSRLRSERLRSAAPKNHSAFAT